jgi:hypothetical protein
VGSQTVELSGAVYRLAEAALGTLNFGNVLVGSSQTRYLNVSNSAIADGFSEGLDAILGDFSGNSSALLSGSGSITNLTAGAANNTALAVTLNTNAAGQVTANVEVLLGSNGATTSGLGVLALPSQFVDVGGLIELQGTVGNLAAASPVTPNPVTLGNVRVGDASPTQTLSLTNTATGPAEGLNASVATVASGLTAGGSFTGLAAGATNSSSLVVGMNTATAGAKSGVAAITLNSDGTFNNGTPTSLAGQNVSVSGAVYQTAQAGSLPATINLGTVRTGTVVDTALAILNSAGDTGGYTETLGASFSTTSSGLTGLGSVSGLSIDLPASGDMTVRFTAGVAGAYEGTAGVNFVSQEINGSGLGNVAAGSQMVGVTAMVNALANLGLSTTSPFSLMMTGASTAVLDFGSIDAAGLLSAALFFTNAVTGPADWLLGSLSESGLAGTPFSIFGASDFKLGAGEASSLLVYFDPATAGDFSGTLALNLASHNPYQSDLDLPGLTLTVRGTFAQGPSGSVPDLPNTGLLCAAALLFLGLGQGLRQGARPATAP